MLSRLKREAVLCHQCFDKNDYQVRGVVHRLSIIIFVLFVVITVITYDYFSLENIRLNSVAINNYIDHNYILSVAVFFVVCAVFVNSPVPLAAVMKLLSGFFFGFHMGAFYNILATVLACLLGFYMSRYAFKNDFEKFYYDRLKKAEDEIEANGFFYFLTLRVMMVVPYFIINIIAGISRVSFKHYLLSTILGVIPASVIYANGGDKLEKIRTVSELFEIDIVLAILMITMFSCLPILIRKMNTA